MLLLFFIYLFIFVCTVSHSASVERREHGMTQNPVYGIARSSRLQQEFDMTKNELYVSTNDVHVQIPEEFIMTENQLYKRVSVNSHDA